MWMPPEFVSGAIAQAIARAFLRWCGADRARAAVRSPSAQYRQKHPKVIAWLSRHPRVTFHFTPTSASWLNAVAGFFAVLTKRRLRRGAFVGVVDLQAAINRYLADHNTDPKPFRWKADPDKIIAAASRGHQTLDSIH
jgi:hypothetical protein